MGLNLSTNRKANPLFELNCFYGFLKELAAKENGFDFIATNDEGRKKRYVMDKNGSYYMKTIDKNGQKAYVKVEELAGKKDVIKNETIFRNALFQYLKDKDLLIDYLPIMRLADLSDQAIKFAQTDDHVSYISFYLPVNGFDVVFSILPAIDGVVYRFKEKEIKLDEAKKVFAKYAIHISLQMKTALERTCTRIANSNTNEDEQSKKAREELGITSTVDQSGRIIVKAEGVLKKASAKQAVSDEVARKAEEARKKIFGK